MYDGLNIPGISGYVTIVETYSCESKQDPHYKRKFKLECESRGHGVSDSESDADDSDHGGET